MKLIWILSAYFLLLSCTSQNNSSTTSNFDYEGHRGCRGLYPENTIPAMLHALDLGVTTLEMDIVFTKDLLPVLSHDPFFNPELTTVPNGDTLQSNDHSHIIFQLPYSVVSSYDVGKKFYPRFPRQLKMAAQIPLLTAVLDSVLEYCKQHNRPLPYFNIETKTKPETDSIHHPAPSVFVDLLLAALNSEHILPNVIIQSFDVRTLQYLHEHYPDVATSLLVEKNTPGSMQAQIDSLNFTPTIYSPEFILVDSLLIQRCHKQKMKIIPWTVNELTEMKRLKNMGVDGLISDYPDTYRYLQ